MPYTVSTLVDHPGFFLPDAPDLPVHGANLVTSAVLRTLASSERVGALEVFVPPALMASTAALAEAARAALPPERRGLGVLRFYPVHALPDVWADGAPRVLMTVDPEMLDRDRYLRDRFALGPTPIVCDSHALGHQPLWGPLRRVGAARPVPYDCLLGISRAVCEALPRAFDGFLAPAGTPPPFRIEQIPHGVDADLFRPAGPERREAARRALGLPTDARILLYLGRLSPHAKADLLPLVTVFAEASTQEDFLLMAGIENAPGYGARLLEAAAELGVRDRVALRTPVPQALRTTCYAAADVFVFPGDTVQEALGNTILEAMASGLPVVASDWDGMRDIVTHEVTGLLVPTWWMPGLGRVEALSPATPVLTSYMLLAQSVWVDTGALARALRALLRSPRRCAEMGAAGRARVERELTWARVMERWFALWDALLEEAAREAPAEREARRGEAAGIGLPAPYLRLFDHYATGVIDPERQCVRLTDTGRAVLEGRQALRFYDETLCLLRQEVVDAALDALRRAEPAWALMRALVEAISSATGCAQEDVRYHLGLLLKRAVIEISPPVR